jgi:phenylacetate-CoA ligase
MASSTPAPAATFTSAGRPSPALWDALEARRPEQRTHDLSQALPRQVAAAQAVPAMAEALAGVDAHDIQTMQALAALPVLRKHDLMARQREACAASAAPLAGYSALGWRRFAAARRAQRIFQSPGPLYEPEAATSDYWRSARAMHAAGFEAGDLVHVSFSYHLTPGAWLMESGAHALGCTTFPGGVGNTEQQLQALADLQADAYAGTPSFLRILLEKAGELGLPITRHLRKALVSGEAFPPTLRDALLAQGVAAFQAYATADCGVIAYETAAREGLVVDEGVVLEIVRPGTGIPVSDGEVGEVLVTALNPDYPLLRFATGDLSAILPGPCPTGRTGPRIRGWLGRADQTAKIKGMFVHPSQLAQLGQRHPELGRLRLVVQGEMANDRMTLHAETSDPAAEGLANRVAASLRELTKLRGEVLLCAPGSLPNDGKVIEDLRRYD